VTSPLSHKLVAIPRRRSAVLVLGTCLSLVAVLGACGTSKAANGDGNTTSTTTTTQTTPSTSASTTTSSIPVTGPSLATIAASKTVKIDGKTVKVPTDSGVSVAVNNDDADGQDIAISVAGFLPLKLYSTPSEPIVWTNLTDQPQQVIFDHFPVTSPVIPPGGTFSWKSASSESISYHSASGMHAVVVINPPGI
jgi:hypothetical protein